VRADSELHFSAVSASTCPDAKKMDAKKRPFSRLCFLLSVKSRLIPLKNAVQNLILVCFSVEYSARYQSFTVAPLFYLVCGCAKLTEKDSTIVYIGSEFAHRS
jgi:hypothetical protein